MAGGASGPEAFTLLLRLLMTHVECFPDEKSHGLGAQQRETCNKKKNSLLFFFSDVFGLRIPVIQKTLSHENCYLHRSMRRE